jgi:RNA polymerase sigma-70 factor (ECF subfamily)
VQRRSDGFDHRWQTLHQCMAKLPAEHRDLLMRRYSTGGSVRAIAAQLGRPIGSISQSLYRIRRLLLDCVKRSAQERTVR